MDFLHDDYLLPTPTAQRLYHEHAAPQPIYDYHCHLDPAVLGGNQPLGSLYDVWLGGDHYKWRAMRANGVDEQLITGDADPYDKFLAYARTVPNTLRNPLYVWTHLELKRYFGIDTLLNGDTAKEIWDQANAQLATTNVRSVFDKMNVALVGTIDDPCDSLEHHLALAKNSPYDTTVIPTFRPDRAYKLDDIDAWNAWVDQLASLGPDPITKLKHFKQALADRHAYFHAAGSRLSDHGFEAFAPVTCTEDEAKTIFKQARRGELPTVRAQQKLLVYLMLFFCELDHAAGWAKQIHLGVIRNVNRRAMKKLGPDTGFDTITDTPQGAGLASFLGEAAGRGHLPQTILYNLNPADNYLFATMCGNFQGMGSGPGHVQWGSGWWFNDQRDGMTDQIDILSQVGLLQHFVGMLTDSRSLLSYPRHEMFRRILCSAVGRDADAGELPQDPQLLGDLIEGVCFKNARDYFDMPLPKGHSR